MKPEGQVREEDKQETEVEWSGEESLQKEERIWIDVSARLLKQRGDKGGPSVRVVVVISSKDTEKKARNLWESGGEVTGIGRKKRKIRIDVSA